MALQTGVIYLLKDRVQIYSPLNGKVLEMKFTAEMVRDLDVINLELIENSVKTFITNGKIAPLGLIIVLADNTYFTKDFVPPAPQKTNTPAIAADVTKELLHNQAEQFVEHVPFDNVVSKTIPLKNGIRVCATNKDFYEAIAAAFEHNNFSLVSILPALVVAQGFGAQPVLSAAMATTLLTKVNTLKEYDLLNQQVYQPVSRQELEDVDEVALAKQQPPKKASKKQLYLVVAIFAVVIILLVVVVMQFMAPPPRNVAATPPPPPVVHQPVATPTTTATESAALTSTLSVQIINSTASATTAETLRQKLTTYNFKKVSTQTQTSLGSSSTVVSFTADTPQTTRDDVLKEVRQVKTNITVQDKANDVYDITIILGE